MQEYILKNLGTDEKEVRIFVCRENGQWLVHFDSGLKLGEFKHLGHVENVLRAAQRHYEKALGIGVKLIAYLDMCSTETFPEE